MVLAGVIVSLYKIFPRDIMFIILIMLIDVWSSEMWLKGNSAVVSSIVSRVDNKREYPTSL